MHDCGCDVTAMFLYTLFSLLIIIGVFFLIGRIFWTMFYGCGEKNSTRGDVVKKEDQYSKKVLKSQ